MTEITDLNPTDASNTALTGNGIQGTNFVSNFDNAMRSLLGLLGRLNSGAAPIADTFTIADPVDLTKRFRFDGGLITAGQTRVITVPDTNITLGGGTAASITFTPAGNIAATDVQAAIQELDSEKQAASAALSAYPDPTANDADSLGIAGTAWSDLFLATGGVINWANGDVLITHSSNLLAFTGASSGYSFDAAVLPSANDAAALGAAATSWADLFLASGALINFANGNYTITHSSGTLTLSGALSIGTSNAFTAGTIELGAASDTTLSRGAAGFIAVEGNRVPSPASQASGDTLYRGSTEWERLAKGTAYQLLRMNSGATAPEWATARDVLTANRTYYVRTDGSDSNTGLVNNAGGAFLTLQKAFDTMATLDGNGYSVTIQQGTAGTLTGSFNANKYLIGIASVVLDLGGGTLSTTSATAVTIQRPMHITVQNGTLQTTTDGSGIRASGAGVNVTLGSSVTFGACASAHILMRDGAKLTISNAYTISGNAPHHYQIEFSGILEMANFTVTLSGTRAFATSFAFVYMDGVISAYSVSYSGSATGKRYDVTIGGIINTFGGGTSYFPGNSAGTGTNFGASPYGQYS